MINWLDKFSATFVLNDCCSQDKLRDHHIKMRDRKFGGGFTSQNFLKEVDFTFGNAQTSFLALYSRSILSNYCYIARSPWVSSHNVVKLFGCGER